ncbi:hypothetical protein H9X57_06695 [Flavobacterium piscinae]|uniref:hypothetical protein n=1 Tax=Flavobacterium piscinae TaxID=2506424 RepID=UPI0019B889B0|nr:hypothetical protein [Flavobacterium piscinae]MBC8883211.1 hypothetical protein [Flavobacterium piscinae]
MNEIGVFSFQSIISSQKAVYLNPDDIDFEQKLYTIIQKNNNLPKNTTLISSQENLFEL